MEVPLHSTAVAQNINFCNFDSCRSEIAKSRQENSILARAKFLFCIYFTILNGSIPCLPLFVLLFSYLNIFKIKYFQRFITHKNQQTFCLWNSTHDDNENEYRIDNKSQKYSIHITSIKTMYLHNDVRN